MVGTLFGTGKIGIGWGQVAIGGPGGRNQSLGRGACGEGWS